MCDGTLCCCNLLEPGDPDYRPRLGWLARWRRRRACFHGRPANWGTPGVDGASYVRCLGMINGGMEKLWECDVAAGGCGRRWT